MGRESWQTLHSGGSWVASIQILCRDHLLPTDFVTPEGILLNRLAVPRGLDSASHSIPQLSPPLLPTLPNPQPSAVSPQNSNHPLLQPLPLTSELTAEENSLQVLPPLRTYSKLRSSSTHIETPLPTQPWSAHCGPLMGGGCEFSHLYAPGGPLCAPSGEEPGQRNG